MPGRTARAAAAVAALLLVLCFPTPATAQPVYPLNPGDVATEGVSVDIDTRWDGPTVIDAHATIGQLAMVRTDGSRTLTDLPIALPGAVGVTTSGTVDEVTVTRSTLLSVASARVSGLRLTMLGVDVVTTAEVISTLHCPWEGPLRLDSRVTGLALFGEPVVLNHGGRLDASAPVTVPGLVSATLAVTVDLHPWSTPFAADGGPFRIFVNLSGRTAEGENVIVGGGSMFVAYTRCIRPLTPAPPVATSLDPDRGPQSGGPVVTLRGENFVPYDFFPGTGTAVVFDGIRAEPHTVSRRFLTVTPPPHAPGPVTVTVYTPYGRSGPLTYTYLADGSDATVTGLSPNQGSTTGGTRVTLTGTGLTAATGVRFGDQLGSGFTVNPAGTSISVTTPPRDSGGAVPVEVRFPAGEVIAATRFSYRAPSIDAVAPDAGPTGGGTPVTITGTDLSRATRVLFGDNPGAGLVVDPSGTSLTVVSPAGPPGPADVRVLLPGADAVAADGFRYLAPGAPTASGIEPDRGPRSGGRTVTVTGNNFVPGDTTVTFDGVPATNVVVAPDGTSLTAVTPANAVGPAAVAVRTPRGVTAPLHYTYLADGSDTVVTGLTPTSGPTSGGTTVTITGTGFTGATGVTFDDVPGTDFTVNPAGTNITVVTPPNAAGPADVELVFPAGTTDAGTFNYLGPTIESVSPPSGPSTGRTTVTITAGNVTGATGVRSAAAPAGFLGATGVNFGDTPGTNLVVDPSGTSLTVVTPPGQAGPVDVTVLLPGADAVAPDGFTYRYVGQGLPVTGDATSSTAELGATVLVLGIGLILQSRRRRGTGLAG